MKEIVLLHDCIWNGCFSATCYARARCYHWQVLVLFGFRAGIGYLSGLFIGNNLVVLVISGLATVMLANPVVRFAVDCVWFILDTLLLNCFCRR